MSREVSRKLTETYVAFFKKAEKSRRWNVYEDIPWNKVNKNANEKLARCAETFACVELYLPDYAGKGLCLVRGDFGMSWFMANWAYEESKHALSLMEYLIRSGKRTEEQMEDLRQEILSRQWSLPHDTPRRMTMYGVVQELATFMFYRKHKEFAEQEHDEALAQIYHLISRDEMAHHNFYRDVVKILIEEDRQGALADLAHVFKTFRMPAEDLVPNYDERILSMRETGVHSGVFFEKVWIPILKELEVTRRELRAAERASADIVTESESHA